MIGSAVACRRDRLAEVLQAFELVETLVMHLRRARQVQRQLASKHHRGQTVRDLLIDAPAESRKLTVVHDDLDLDRVVAVTCRGRRTASDEARAG